MLFVLRQTLSCLSDDDDYDGQHHSKSLGVLSVEKSNVCIREFCTRNLFYLHVFFSSPLTAAATTSIGYISERVRLSFRLTRTLTSLSLSLSFLSYPFPSYVIRVSQQPTPITSKRVLPIFLFFFLHTYAHTHTHLYLYTLETILL